jgi:cytochrome b6-f complex iron-sulfur subunit
MNRPLSPLRGAAERLSDYVDDLLAERRPRRFLAQSADELRLLQAAARLRGARPEADRPDAAFLADLRRQLAAPPAAGLAAAEASPAPADPSRRRLLARAAASLAGLAAALAAGFGLGRLSVTSPTPAPLTDPAGPEPAAGGRWLRAAALAEVPEGEVLRFSAGPLVGHLVNAGDGLYALSAVCTHRGCIVRWSRREREFECPCHDAAFALDGRMKYAPSSYRDPLPPLPIIETRVRDGQVYVRSASTTEG